MRFNNPPLLKICYAVVLWTGTACFALTQSAQGQEQRTPRGLRRAESGITTTAPEEVAHFRSAGLFIGVREFDDENIPVVPFAVDDAVDLAYLYVETLQQMPATNVTLALAGEPAKETSKEKLQHLFKLGAQRLKPEVSELFKAVKRLGKTAGSDGIFVVSVATHGVLEGGRHFLMAKRSILKEIENRKVSYEKKADRSIDRDEFIEAIDRTGAARMLLFIDACQERLAPGIPRTPRRSIRAPVPLEGSQYQGRVVMFAAQAGDLAFDDTTRGNGVFTGAIIDGLKGAARSDGSDVITVADLQTYVDTQVKKRRREFDPRVIPTGGIYIEMPPDLRAMPLVKVFWNEVQWTNAATPLELECPREPRQSAEPDSLGKRMSSRIFLTRSTPDDAFRYLVLGRTVRQASFGRKVHEYELAVVCKSSKQGVAWPLGEVVRPKHNALSYREQPKLGGKAVTDVVLPLTDQQGRRGSLFWNGQRFDWTGPLIQAATIVPTKPGGADEKRQLLLVTDSDVVSVTVTRSPPSIVSQQQILNHGGTETAAVTWQHQTAIVMLDSQIVMLQELAGGGFEEFSRTRLPATQFADPVRSFIDFPSRLDSIGVFVVYPQACDPGGKVPFVAFRLDLVGDAARGGKSPLSKIGHFEVQPMNLRSHSCAIHLVPNAIGVGGRTFKVHALYNCSGSSGGQGGDGYWCHQAFLRQGSEPGGRLEPIGAGRRFDGRLNTGAVSRSGRTLYVAHFLNGETHEKLFDLE